jgi:hypothetical protein
MIHGVRFCQRTGQGLQTHRHASSRPHVPTSTATLGAGGGLRISDMSCALPDGGAVALARPQLARPLTVHQRTDASTLTCMYRQSRRRVERTADTVWALSRRANSRRVHTTSSPVREPLGPSRSRCLWSTRRWWRCSAPFHRTGHARRVEERVRAVRVSVRQSDLDAVRASHGPRWGRAARGHDEPANVVIQVTESPPPQLGFRGRLGNDSTQNGPGHLNGHCPFARLRPAWNGCFNHNPSRGPSENSTVSPHTFFWGRFSRTFVRLGRIMISMLCFGQLTSS